MDNNYRDIEQKIKNIFMFCAVNNMNYTLTYEGSYNLIEFDNKNVIINIYDIEDENLNEYLELKLIEIKENYEKKQIKVNGQ